MIDKLKTVLSTWRQWWIVSIVSILLGLIPTWWNIIKDISEHFSPSFKARLTLIWEPANMVCGGDGEFYQRVPLEFTAFIDITNASKQSQRILGYEIEENIENKWNTFQANYCTNAVLEIDDKYFEVKRLDDDLPFKTIKEGDSVYGWSFFTKKDKSKKIAFTVRLG